MYVEKISIVLLAVTLIFYSCSSENPLKEYKIFMEMPIGSDFKKVSTKHDDLEVFINFRWDLSEILLIDVIPYRKRSQADSVSMINAVKEKDKWYNQLLIVQKELIANKEKVKRKFKPLIIQEFPAYFSEEQEFRQMEYFYINKEYALKNTRRNLATNQRNNQCDVVHYAIVNSKAYELIDMHYVICGTGERKAHSENFEKAVENAILLK